MSKKTKFKFHNPFVQHLITKKQGPMGPSKKQQKKQDRANAKKLLKSMT